MFGKPYGLDFNNDGEISFKEEYLTRRITMDYIKENDSYESDCFDGTDDSYDSFGTFGSDFGGEDW